MGASRFRLPEPDGVDREQLAPAHTLRRLAIVLPVGLAVLVYHPILRNYFYNDDFWVLFDVANGYPLWSFLFEHHFGHVVVVPNAVRYALQVALGPHPQGYFVFMLATHALNVALLYGVLRLVTGRPGLAVFGAGLWGTSPLHGETLGWYTGYENVLGNTALLLLLRQYAGPDRCAAPITAGRAARSSLLLVAAGTSYGGALGCALVLPVLLVLFLRPTISRAAVLTLAAAPLVLAALTLISYAITPPFTGRFAPMMRITPSSVFAARWTIAAYLVNLLGVDAAGFALGHWFDPGRWPGLLACTVGVLCATTVAAGLLAAPSAYTRRMTALFALLACVTAGTIAAGRSSTGHAPTVLGLTQRHHYVCQMFLTLAVCVAAGGVLQRLTNRGQRLASGFLAGIGLAAAAGWLLTPAHIDNHRWDREETMHTLADIRAAVAQAPVGSTVAIPNRQFNPVWLISAFLAPGRIPGWAAVFVIFFPTDMVEGRRVRFVAQGPDDVAAIAAGGRVAELLVQPSP